MGGAALLTALAAAGSVGMGCGTCCGSAAGAFFSGYLMTHARSFRESFGGFLRFYLGKVLAVASICLASSLAGSRLLDEEGYIGGVPLLKAVDHKDGQWRAGAAGFVEKGVLKACPRFHGETPLFCIMDCLTILLRSAPGFLSLSGRRSQACLLSYR